MKFESFNQSKDIHLQIRVAVIAQNQVHREKKIQTNIGSISVKTRKTDKRQQNNKQQKKKKTRISFRKNKKKKCFSGGCMYFKLCLPSIGIVFE